MTEHNFAPQFALFELLQDTKTGKLFVATEVKYVATKNWFGKIISYQFKYNNIAEQQIKRVMNAHDAWEQGVLADPKMFVPKS